MTVVPCASTTTSALDTSRPLPMCEITPPLQRIVSASKMPISKSPETSVPIFLIARILISRSPNSVTQVSELSAVQAIFPFNIFLAQADSLSGVTHHLRYEYCQENAWPSARQYGTSRRLALNPLIFEPEGLVPLDDAAHGRLGEMCCTHHHVALAIPLQETTPRGSCERAVKIGAHDPSRFKTLHGTVDAIARDNRFRALGSKMHAHVPRGMAGSGFQPNFVVERKVVADELRLARLHDRQNAIEELRLRVLPVQRLKAFPFALGEDVLRVRERGYPLPVA